MATGEAVTVADIDAAVAALRAQNIPPGPDGYYVVAVHPKNLTRLFKEQMAENTARRWRMKGAR